MMTLAILMVGAWLVMQNDGFTVGMLVAFQMFAGRLSQPLLRLVGLWQELQQAGIAVKRLGDIMNAPGEPCSLVPQRGKAEAGRIEVEGIAFRYGPEQPWLYRDLSIGLAPGRCLALMGPSGSGKSTLAKLLQGFYFPEEGRITLDGRDLRHLPANELRSHFGVVPQETILFSGTLYDNLILANPRATFEQVVQACQWAEIHDTIEKLPKRATRPRWASAASACRAGRSSASPSPGRSSSSLASSSSTRRRRTSIPTRRSTSPRRSTNSAAR
jgi:subfamily B ATP-binding cassette protein HlyB/CyaB